MDGDGSIQVNHWRKKSLQYRLIIKLKYCDENISMLKLISQKIGGRVKIVKNNTNVIWVVDSKKSIEKIIQIFNYYPPLTSRLRAQLKFMCECFKHNNVETYLKLREYKYISRDTFVDVNQSYFNEWLSGFIEAEGCFPIRKNNNHSFSIGQNNDKYIIDAIKIYFKIESSVRNTHKIKEFWIIETYRVSTLNNIITHFNNYPLIGQKLISYNKFKNIVNKK